MTQEEILIHRVLDRPDDDAPRLDYAAFMTEKGDPRGEFVRIEVELARMDKDAEPNYLPLAEASYAMTDRYGQAFAGPIAGMVDTYFFDRGFVELVELTARKFLEIAPRLYSLAPVRHLNLKGSRSLIPELFSSPNLQPIRSLEIRNWRLTDRDMETLASSPYLKQLRWLSIADNLVGLPGAEALAASKNLPNLRYVVFTGNPVDPSERYGSDSGYVADSWMEEPGVLLEEKYGPIRWLHADPFPRRTTDIPPNRFVV
jgi:uncharacterized protein (TIGR02996 family)